MFMITLRLLEVIYRDSERVIRNVIGVVNALNLSLRSLSLVYSFYVDSPFPVNLSSIRVYLFFSLLSSFSLISHHFNVALPV